MRLLLLLSALQGPGSGPVLITNTTVLDLETGGATAGRSILIRDGRIVEVGPAGGATPPGTRVIDGQGRYVIPGLWDMHVHAALPQLDKLFLPLLLANGVTGVREMWSQIPWIDSSRAQVSRGELVGPRIYGAGNLVDGVPPIWPGSMGVAGPDEARRAVDSLARQGADFIKVYSRLAPETYRAIAAEAKRLGIPFAGHIPTLVAPAEASDLGQRTVEHVATLPLACSKEENELRAEIAAAVASGPKGWDSAGLIQRRHARRELDSPDSDRCRALARRFARNQTWMVPTMVVLRSVAYLDDTTLAQDPRLVYIPPAMSGTWNPRQDFRFRSLTAEDWALRKTMYARQRELVGLFRREGVGFLAGTDLANPYIFPGFSLHDEMALMVETGFTPLEALQAATIGPARFLGAADSMGTVARGNVADLVLLDANPLENIRNTTRIAAVISGGRVFDRAALDSLLAAGRGRARGAAGR